MPLIQSSQDHLPCLSLLFHLFLSHRLTNCFSDIDSPPSQTDLSSAKALIAASLPSNHLDTLHERMPPAIESRFSDLVEAEHARLASGAVKEGGIDLSRYEAQDAPSSNDIAEWRATLQKAYTSSEYLQSRLTNLSLLETYGKNAWLISNDQLEHILRDVEKDVVERKRVFELLAQERRDKQEASKGELQTLDQSWRTGVGRMLEVEAAAEGLRREILERKRMAAK